MSGGLMSGGMMGKGYEGGDTKDHDYGVSFLLLIVAQPQKHKSCTKFEHYLSNTDLLVLYCLDLVGTSYDRLFLCVLCTEGERWYDGG
jgi:hypothetical protein